MNYHIINILYLLGERVCYILNVSFFFFFSIVPICQVMLMYACCVLAFRKARTCSVLFCKLNQTFF